MNPTQNLLIEARNQIVNGCIQAAEEGALCRVPESFSLSRETAIGTLAYTVPIVLTGEESARAGAAFAKHPVLYPVKSE